MLKLKTRWADGTTHLRLSPQQLLERLAALIPRPRTNQLLYHGVFAANAKWRARIVPGPPRTHGEPAPPASRPNHTCAATARPRNRPLGPPRGFECTIPCALDDPLSCPEATACQEMASGELRCVSSGCGCRVVGRGATPTPWLLLGLLALLRAQRC